MLIYILAGIAAVIAVLVVVIAMQPTDFRITRPATIPAPVLFAQVNDFHNWQAWSPWAKMDPTARNSFAGAPSGEPTLLSPAQLYIAPGKMTLLESRSGQSIRIKLEFLKPFQATHTAEFTFMPASDGTLVTWSMSGKNNFMAKAFVLIMNCDKMVGGQFEEGLANLRDVTTGEMTSGH